MASSSFFIQRQEDALRHVNLLAKELKKVAMAGWVGGAGCSAFALMLTHFLVPAGTASNRVPGFHEISGVTFVTWSMATALLVFSSLYYLTGWALARKKQWARYAGAATFLLKIMLCVWLGCGSVAAMVVFLLIAAGDMYGLWVLLAKETGQLFVSPEASHVSAVSSPTT